LVRTKKKKNQKNEKRNGRKGGIALVPGATVN